MSGSNLGPDNGITTQASAPDNGDGWMRAWY